MCTHVDETNIREDAQWLRSQGGRQGTTRLLHDEAHEDLRISASKVVNELHQQENFLEALYSVIAIEEEHRRIMSSRDGAGRQEKMPFSNFVIIASNDDVYAQTDRWMTIYAGEPLIMRSEWGMVEESVLFTPLKNCFGNPLQPSKLTTVAREAKVLSLVTGRVGMIREQCGRQYDYMYENTTFLRYLVGVWSYYFKSVAEGKLVPSDETYHRKENAKVAQLQRTLCQTMAALFLWVPTLPGLNPA